MIPTSAFRIEPWKVMKKYQNCGIDESGFVSSCWWLVDTNFCTKRVLKREKNIFCFFGTIHLSINSDLYVYLVFNPYLVARSGLKDSEKCTHSFTFKKWFGLTNSFIVGLFWPSGLGQLEELVRSESHQRWYNYKFYKWMGLCYNNSNNCCSYLKGREHKNTTLLREK